MEYNVGDKLKCKKDCAEALIFPNDPVNGRFCQKDKEYTLHEINNPFNCSNDDYYLSIFEKDSKDVERDIIQMYPLFKYQLEMFFDKI